MKTAVQLATERLQKRFKGSVVGAMSEGALSDVDEVIPTGIPVVDNYVIGCGGLPLRRIIEVFGNEASGKTSFVFSCLAAAQKAGYGTVLIETEDSLDTNRASLFGMNLEDVLLLTPDSMEEAFSQIEETLATYVECELPCLIALDSIAATPTRAEIDEGLDFKAAMAVKARFLSRAIPIASNLLKKSNACLLLVNQTREAVGKMFGDKVVTPGGKAIKFHASLRLKMFSAGALKQGTMGIGQKVGFSGVKNKVGYPWRTAQTEFLYDEGWVDDWSYLNLAKDLKLIPDGTRKSPKSCAESLVLLRENNWKPVPKLKKEALDGAKNEGEE